MQPETTKTSRTIPQILGWNRTSYLMMSSFTLLIFVIGYVWWPLLEEYISTYNPNLPFWIQFDWLLLIIFMVMSLLIMAKADIKMDIPIIAVGFFGGLVIESWGTQTELWVYYTFERPPLWIIPAWPIASLSIDRLFRLMDTKTKNIPEQLIKFCYWLFFIGFYIYLLYFVFPTIDKSLTIMALVLCAFLILTPVNHRAMLFTFIAGSGLGYFLELWGTTRFCWTYYTLQTPPFFAVLAHGMAAVAFWRVVQLFWIFLPHTKNKLNPIVEFKKKKSTVRQ
jgi:MFS family permease